MGIFNHMNDNPNNKVISSSNKSTFFIYVYYKKSKNNAALFLNDTGLYNIIIPCDCCLKEITTFITSLDINNEDFLIAFSVVIVGRSGENPVISNYHTSTENNKKQNIPIDLD